MRIYISVFQLYSRFDKYLQFSKFKFIKGTYKEHLTWYVINYI
jgi:hypothetical protein